MQRVLVLLVQFLRYLLVNKYNGSDSVFICGAHRTEKWYDEHVFPESVSLLLWIWCMSIQDFRKACYCWNVLYIFSRLWAPGSIPLYHYYTIKARTLPLVVYALLVTTRDNVEIMCVFHFKWKKNQWECKCTLTVMFNILENNNSRPRECK